MFESKILSVANQNVLTQLCKFDDQKWTLIYRASRDGFESKNFHLKCDTLHNTISIIKSSNGNIFGGFTSAAWSINNEYADDPFAFIFSVVNEKCEPFLIPCLESADAIYCSENYGPCFGWCDIKIADKANLNTVSFSNLGFTYEHKNFSFHSLDARTILAGSKRFQVEDIEVFKKDYKTLSKVTNFTRILIKI